MLVKNEVLTIQRSGDFVETGFKIKASAKAFAILSSGLYSNKIRAIVRELSTNAVDAHRMVGNQNVPFKVHLPNILEPFFSLRDYGTGLSPEDIVTVYTTYFESTKTMSNDDIGCLGLGSKSPFSYTDNFNIVDYFNGVKHTYTAFIGEAGCPTIALMSTEDTTEPNGLEVSFAVKNSDFNRFVDEAKFVYSYFKVKPEITGQTVVYPDKPLLSVEGSDWKLYNGSRTNVVVMGNIAYPINLYEVEFSGNLFNYYSIEIEAAIGEVEMTASREALEYTNKTKSAILKRLQEASDSFESKLQEELEKKETLWDATKFYAENAMFLAKSEWHGQTVRSSIYFKKEYPASKLSKVYLGIKVKKFRTLSHLDPRDSCVVVVNDVRGGLDRAKQYMKDKNISNGFVVTFTDEELQEVLDILGPIPDGTIVKASSLPKVIREYTKRGPSPQTLTFVPKREKASDSWENAEEIDLEEGGVYVEVNHWSPEGFSNEILTEIYQTLTNLGHKIDIIGIRKKTVEKIKDNADWKPLKVYIEEVCAKFSSDYDYAQTYSDYKHHEKLVQLGSELTGTGMADLVKKIEYCSTNCTRLYNIFRLMHFCNIKHEPTHKPDEEVQSILEKYPLVQWIITNAYGRYLPVKEIGNYIKLVDGIPLTTP